MNLKDPEGYLALGAIAGAIVSKIGSVIIRRQFSEAADIRKELRDETHKLAKRVDEVSRELDTWKDKYYKLTNENIELRLECRHLRNEIEKLKSELDAANSTAP